MPCVPLTDRNNKIVGFVCGFHPVYEFEGYLFEVHNYFGPMPLRRDNHEPRVTTPRGFWEAWDRFNALVTEEKQTYCFDVGEAYPKLLYQGGDDAP